ncbi:MAG: hypothetical protein J0I74_10215 [Rhodanobacter sp.]|uniref:Uncharacterized protein n=1 Tax=Rhodanobacter geophilus TaxID=3162488 RepID=A0ABV3QQ07_9GAMM|nr:hypothetical protein [Rhodanobacter sp.]
MEFIAVLLLWIGSSAGIGLLLIGDRYWARTTTTRFNTDRSDNPIYQPPGRIGIDGWQGDSP